MQKPRMPGSVALCLLLLLGAASWCRGADEPQIGEAVDAAGHTGKVWKALFTRDGRRLITVSEDKTARVWDLETGTVRQTYRLPGTGPAEGRLYTAALSPDGKMLAAGGYGLNGGLHFIYLISLETNEILKVLNGHSDVVDAVAFSPDGKKLLSGSHDQTARLWDIETRQTEHLLTAHAGEVYGVAFSPDGKRGATAAFDKTVRVWDLEKGNEISELTGHTAEVRCVCWSPDGKTLVTGAEDGTVRLWSPDGKPQKVIDSLGSRTITSLSLSPDGGRALFTQGFGEGPRTCGILDLASGKPTVTFAGQDGLILDGTLSADGTMAATSGGDDHQVVLWRTADGKPVQTLSAAGRSVWAAAWSADGSKIAWGHTNAGRSLAGNMPLERTFDLKTLSFAGAPDMSYRAAALQQPGLGIGGFEDNAVIFQAEPGDAVRVELSDAWDRLNCVTLLPDRRAVIASDAGLFLYDTASGKPLREFIGHSGRVRALSTSPDGKYFLSGSEDMTLRIWDLDHSSPLLSFLPAGEEWIAWTPEGYYASSPGGERLVGWRVDNGLNKLATFLPASQVRKGLYRPDVISALLASGSIEKAIASRGGSDQTDIRNALPPTVQITVVEKPEEGSSELTLEALAIQQGSAPIVSMQVLLDGRPLNGRAGRLDFDKPAAQVRQNLVVPLTPGMAHELVVRADTALGHGLSSPVTYAFKLNEDSSGVRTLHVLGIGVSAFQAPELRRESARRDVQAVVDAFQHHSAKVFNQVQTQVVLDAEATRAGILGALSNLRKAMTPKDTAVIYLSGLGQRDETGSFLLPHDVDPSSLIVTAIPDSQFKTMLLGIPGKVILLVDTPSPNDTSTGANVDDLVRDLAHDDLGVMAVALSAGSPAEPDKPSLFSRAVVEALAVSAPVSPDAELTALELARHVRSSLTSQKLPVAIGIPALMPPVTLSRR